ncbi:MAG: cell division protein ZapA, partial [Pseudomonadota bacterium]|nr:cell division protein ZapA [Pseudomonadota bacterium]
PRMNDEPANTITVKLMDRDFQVKCPPDKVNDLQQAAAYLDIQMREVANTSKIQSLDRIAAIAALNVVHDLKTEKYQSHHYIDTISNRIQSLHNKIEKALAEEGA